MCSLNIERNIFIGFGLLCNKFFNFYNTEVCMLHTGQILELDFFACFAFFLLLSWSVNIFSPIFTSWGKSYTAVLLHWHCIKMVSAALLTPCQLEAGSCQLPSPPAASGAGLGLAEVWYHGWERQLMGTALQMPSVVLEAAQEHFVLRLAFAPGIILSKRACSAFSCSMLYLFIC